MTTLLSRIAQNDSEAVRECIRRYRGLVWSIARRFTRSTIDAEDAVQDVFVAVWRSAARFDETAGSEATFISTIARRRLIDRLRRTQRRPATETLDSELVDHGNDRIEARAEAVLATRVINRLRPAQREVLMLSAMHGMSHGEIANTLDLPLGTVKTHARRAMIRVRRELLSPLAA
jgi:RNA polymerase sigma-70 factor (ECF subfamily)